VFVSYALPGELVEAIPTGHRKGVSFARAGQVVEPSDHRVEPKCDYFGACGGCQWQHAVYPYQLELKRRVVEDAWSRAGLRLPPDTPVLGMENPWRYRIRGEFEAVYPQGDGDFGFGFHRMRSYSSIAVESCPIHDLRIEKAMLAFRKVVRECGVNNLQSLSLTAEPTGNGLLWNLRFKENRGVLPEGFADRVAALLPDFVLLDDSMELEFWGLHFRVRGSTFVQTNYQQMLVLYQTALDMLQAGERDSVLDLYSGIGTISLAVARGAERVTAIEENPASVQLAILNARINSTKNVSFLKGKVEDSLKTIKLGSHQAAILDPARAGCEPAAIGELLRLGMGRLVYVSCDPVTHARDIAMLVMGGYRVRRAALVDMFPHTYHVESVALLERGGA
jgi:23S rRNA (uracil1939-C5)-methyltransferase